MSKFNEEIKDILAAVTVYVEETLAREKLSAKAEEGKNRLIKQLNVLKEEYPALKSEADWSKEYTSESKSNGTSAGSGNEIYDAASASVAIMGSDMLKSASISGYLKNKKSGLFTGGKKWCAIRDNIFYLYDKPTDKKQKGQIDLKDVTKKRYLDGGKKNPYGFELNAPSGSHLFFTNNDAELESWMSHLFGTNDDGMELYEDVDDLQKQAGFVAPSHGVPSVPQHPKPQVPEEEEIYEDDPGAAAPPDEIYDDTQQLEEEGETYDDVAQVPITPPRPTQEVRATPPIKQDVAPPGVIDYANLYYALWERQGEQIDELSFKPADILLVKNKTFDQYSWWAAELNGRIGYVPKNFLTPVYLAA